MKNYPLIAAFFFLALPLFAGESCLTVTRQPLDGLGSGEIAITPVTCHDWYAHGNNTSAVGLISAANIPPTNNPKNATADLNLASICKVQFSTSDIGDPEAPLEVIMDLTKFSVSAAVGYPREEIIRASLECLRLCLPHKLRTTPLTLLASDADKLWAGEIVKEFNAHDRTEIFYFDRSR